MRITIFQTKETRKAITVNVPWFKGSNADLQKLMNEIRQERKYETKFKRTKDSVEEEEYEISYNSLK